MGVLWMMKAVQQARLRTCSSAAQWLQCMHMKWTFSLRAAGTSHSCTRAWTPCRIFVEAVCPQMQRSMMAPAEQWAAEAAVPLPDLPPWMQTMYSDQLMRFPAGCRLRS